MDCVAAIVTHRLLFDTYICFHAETAGELWRRHMACEIAGSVRTRAVFRISTVLSDGPVVATHSQGTRPVASSAGGFSEGLQYLLCFGPRYGHRPALHFVRLQDDGGVVMRSVWSASNSRLARNS